jgi:tRNA-binding protein
MATISDFQKLDIRVGKIIEVEDLEGARKPIYKIKIDFGELGIKNSAAGIKNEYTKDELLNKKVIAVVNLEPKNIAGFLSECLILAAVTNDGKVVLLKPEKDVEVGSKIY